MTQPPPEPQPGQAQAVMGTPGSGLSEQSLIGVRAAR
jgi:hypothetical protein